MPKINNNLREKPEPSTIKQDVEAALLEFIGTVSTESITYTWITSKRILCAVRIPFASVRGYSSGSHF